MPSGSGSPSHPTRSACPRFATDPLRRPLAFRDQGRGAQWERMTSEGWFPFAGLKNGTINEIILHCRQGWNLARLQHRIIEECKQLAPEFSESCRSADLFKPHAEAIRLAAGHFVAGDNIRSAHLLYPRIEGILRGYYLAAGAANKPTQERFLAAALSGATGPFFCSIGYSSSLVRTSGPPARGRGLQCSRSGRLEHQ